MDAKMIKRNGDNVFVIASSNNQCQGKSAVSLCPAAATRIPRATAARMTQPDAQQNTKEANIALSTYVEKWKNRYEEAERKHKAYLLKSEKAKREHDELQRRYNIVAEEKRHVEAELLDRERELAKLRAVSEKLFAEYQHLKNQHDIDAGVMQNVMLYSLKPYSITGLSYKLRSVSEKLFAEYQQLKNQHDIDAGVMQKVMQQAGEWYKQNKQLKRRSTALLHALPASAVDIDLTDANDSASDTSSNEEVDFLKRCVSELSAQIATLQTEVSAARLHEFEAHEINVQLTQELETEREKCSKQEKELQDLRNQLERHNRVSKLLMEEMSALKNHADKDRQMAETYKSEARDAKKRAKVLAHQSALLMGELELDERLGLLLGEVDNLRDALEQQVIRHKEQIEDLQLKLAEKHEETDILLWEEKIKLAEEDAQKALERAERAEKKLAELERSRPPKKSNLMSRISYFENGGNERKEVKEELVKEVIREENIEPPQKPPETQTPVIPPAPPSPPKSPTPSPTPPVTTAPPPPPPPMLPPPPPPPPPPPVAFAPPGAVADMADLLASKGAALKKTKQNGGGAIDAIVDQIKGGKFQLKSREKLAERKPQDEQPEAVKEMLQILGTLRKRRVNRPAPLEP